MIRIFLFFSFIFLLGANGATQQTPTTDQKAMQASVIGFFDGLAKLDTATMKSFCTTDILLLESGKIWNIDSLTVRIEKRKSTIKDFKRVNKIDFIETKTANNVAWVSYYNQATVYANNTTTIINWLESVVMRKEKGEWKICLLHSTDLKQ
ncbi:MAG TPA: nuclear transport factor 2 family protein [Phnomibacter sp.]|nr:nuclear transport factor 2 family protein [Phnomibacter sp.]